MARVDACLPMLALVRVIHMEGRIQLNDIVTLHWCIPMRFAKLGLLLWFGNWIPIWNFQIGDKFPIWVERVFLESDVEPKLGKFSPNWGKSYWFGLCNEVHASKLDLPPEGQCGFQIGYLLLLVLLGSSTLNPMHDSWIWYHQLAWWRCQHSYLYHLSCVAQ